jgi:hypothetical protein
VYPAHESISTICNLMTGHVKVTSDSFDMRICADMNKNFRNKQNRCRRERVNYINKMIVTGDFRYGDNHSDFSNCGIWFEFRLGQSQNGVCSRFSHTLRELFRDMPLSLRCKYFRINYYLFYVLVCPSLYGSQHAAPYLRTVRTSDV